ncbi:hypothetical protein [Deinococcus fonticola]|uniref:hypothetical protein n=1 Tax=Deinococcus fonticola TaxID=2528713 RepID=UPI001075149B|nr:hypothetical protein [Deinococcus fonticola]
MTLRKKPQRDEHPDTERRGDGAPSLASGLGGLARRLAKQALDDPRIRETGSQLKHRAEELQAQARDRADRRLEDIIARRGGSDETNELLAQRRQERDLKAGKLRARSQLLALADTPHEKRVLLRVIEGTPWAGGEGRVPRYTELLDTLAPSGEAGAEMAVHRALWSLAERHVLSVSPFGEITASPLSRAARVLENHDHNPTEY